MKKSITTVLALTGAILALGSSPASAITITPSNAGGNAGTDNVLFNVIANDTTNPALGTLNANPGFIVNFNSSSDALIASGGQATLDSADGSFTNLSIFLSDGATFQKLILNPDATSNGTINFSVNYLGMSSPFTGSFALGAGGSNFFQIVAGVGETISSVTLNTQGTAIADSGQIRIGGLAAVPTNVPDGGATVMLLGLTLSGLAVTRRFFSAKS